MPLNWAKFFFYLAIMMAGYFVGAAAGKIYMDVKAASPGGHGSHGEAGHVGDDHNHEEDGAGEDSHAAGDHDGAQHADGEPHGDAEDADGQENSDGKSAEDQASNSRGNNLRQVAFVAADGDEAQAPRTAADLDPEKRKTGIFFSIYYCMTGLHAIHVIAGMIALSWLLYRAIHGHFRPDYFGPVDYVGLYWHLVDLIWIYLFPLLYLIK